MKSCLITLLALTFLDCGWAQKCVMKTCGPCILPTCNFDGNCYHESPSACKLFNEKGRRRNKKLPIFTSTVSGFCLEGSKMCRI